MSLQVTGQAQGLILPVAQKSGAPAAISMGWNNEALVSELMPRFAQLVLAGVVFSVTFPSGTVAAASATSTGPFALFNPNNSGKNLILLAASAPVTTMTAGTTGAGFGLQAVPNQQPTATGGAQTPVNLLIGSGNKSVATGFTSGTMVGAPTTIPYMTSGAYLDVASAAGDVTFVRDTIDGLVIVAPGSGANLVMTGTLVCTLIPTLIWAELAA